MNAIDNIDANLVKLDSSIRRILKDTSVQNMHVIKWRQSDTTVTKQLVNSAKAALLMASFGRINYYST